MLHQSDSKYQRGCNSLSEPACVSIHTCFPPNKHFTCLMTQKKKKSAQISNAVIGLSQHQIYCQIFSFISTRQNPSMEIFKDMMKHYEFRRAQAYCSQMYRYYLHKMYTSAIVIIKVNNGKQSYCHYRYLHPNCQYQGWMACIW